MFTRIYCIKSMFSSTSKSRQTPGVCGLLWNTSLKLVPPCSSPPLLQDQSSLCFSKLPPGGFLEPRHMADVFSEFSLALCEVHGESIEHYKQTGDRPRPDTAADNTREHSQPGLQMDLQFKSLSTMECLVTGGRCVLSVNL